MFNKIIINIFLIIFLASCSSNVHISKKLFSKINNNLQKDYKINNGYLIAVYNLALISQTKTLYDNNYLRIINESLYNDSYLNKFKIRYKTISNIENLALLKIKKIQQTLLILNAKYKFLSNSAISTIKMSGIAKANDKNKIPKKNIMNYLNELYKLDRIMTYIPIMFPEHNAKITSHYGMRIHPLKRKKIFHCGTDIAGRRGSLIYSAAEGKVIKTGNVKNLNGYGQIIEIKHPNNFITRYAHLNIIYVKVGEQVLRGQKIGMQGSTGNTKGEHLHFEIWLNGKHLNPYDFLSKS